MNENREKPTSEEAKAPKAPFYQLRDILGDFRADADAAHEAKTMGKPRGPQTGFDRLNREIGYALAPGLHAVHGNAGTGKTAFCLQMAASCQFSAIYVTCEMAPAELLRRHTARITKTYLGRLKSGEMSGADAEALACQAAEATPDLILLDGTICPVFAERIEEVYELTLKRTKAKTALIVIDSIQSWIEGTAAEAAEAAGETEYRLLNRGIKGLRDLSHKIRAPILFISERNRDSMKSGGLNAGAGSRKIEYGAETVFDLDRDMNDGANSAGEHEVTLRIAKNRHGSVGVEIPLLFNGALQSFRELTTAEAVANTTKGAVNRNGRGKRDLI